jgi:hypothetical protein
VLPNFYIKVSDPSRACLDKLAAEGVITYDDNISVVEVRPGALIRFEYTTPSH